MNRPFNIPHRDPGRRKGGATMETLFILPLLLLIFSATIEISTVIYLKESITVAAYEGARTAIERDGKNKDVRKRVKQILNGRKIDRAGRKMSQIAKITPKAEDAELLEPVNVRITIPVQENLIVPFSWLQFVDYTELTAEVTMLKEYTLNTN